MYTLPSLTKESLYPVSENLTSGTKKIYCSFHDEESQIHAVHQLSDGHHHDDEEELIVVVLPECIVGFVIDSDCYLENKQ